MDQKPNDLEVIHQIIKNRILNIKPVDGKGEVNRVYFVQTENKSVVVRLNNESEISRFKKEEWCMNKAIELNIPSPHVLNIGINNNSAFMILDFIPGLNGKEIIKDESYIWKKLGSYAKKIHSVTTNGFGETLTEMGEFNDTWERYITYNIDSLNEEDKLLSMNVLTLSDSKKLKNSFLGLLEKQFKFGLTHGDLSVANIIVENEKITLIDWGSAESTIVPHFELIGIFEDSFSEDSPLFNDFLAGYEITKEEFESMKPDINSLTILRAIDKLRWAIDRKPELIDEYFSRVKKIVSQF
jgi:tRNA A-37 threonylcarbamoyl transferase component Bud32